jgi:hypothetical protein
MSQTREPQGRGGAWTVFVPPDPLFSPASPPKRRGTTDEGPPPQAARQARRRLDGDPEASGETTAPRRQR